MGKIVRVGPSERLTPHAANNAELPSGALYPDGLPLVAANPIVQASVRPEGTVFVQSPGYETVRTDKHLRGEHGPGIGFTGIGLAEDPTDPSHAFVDDRMVGAHAETHRINPEVPYEGGRALTPVIDHGPGQAPTVGDRMHRVYDTPPDMGDREAHRPLTRAQVQRGLYHPAQLLREEWQTHPVTAVVGALAAVALAYMIGHDLERSYRSRRGGHSVASPAGVGAAPAAAVETAGAEAHKATQVAATAIEDAGSAVKKVTQEAANAVTE